MADDRKISLSELVKRAGGVERFADAIGRDRSYIYRALKNGRCPYPWGPLVEDVAAELSVPFNADWIDEYRRSGPRSKGDIRKGGRKVA